MKPVRKHGFGNRSDGERERAAAEGVPAVDVHDRVELERGRPVAVHLNEARLAFDGDRVRWRGAEWCLVELGGRWSLVPARASLGPADRFRLTEID